MKRNRTDRAVVVVFNVCLTIHAHNTFPEKKLHHYCLLRITVVTVVYSRADSRLTITNPCRHVTCNLIIVSVIKSNPITAV